MPASFDFINGPAFLTSERTGSFTFDDVNGLDPTQTVKFTISWEANRDVSVAIGLTGASPGLSFSLPDSPAFDDTLMLVFSEVGSTGNNILSATSMNPVVLKFAEIEEENRITFTFNGSAVVFNTSTADDLTAFNGSGFGTQFRLTSAVTEISVGKSITGIRFTTPNIGGTVVGGRIRLTELSANALNCFLAGTRIATPDGEVPVEALKVGDVVLTADGRAVEVWWLGQQFVDTRLTHPAKVNPICISAGALSEGVPSRDLYVSPDHALEVDGYLITAMALVNGVSIYQLRNMPLEGFTFYHIETEVHESLLAEGCPAESFLDYTDTFGFDNAGERVARVIPEMDMPRISSARLVPGTIRVRIADRAALLRETHRAGRRVA